MSAENSAHITKVNSILAATSGALLGASILFPPAAGFGIAVGAVGLIREQGHQRDIEMKNLQDYLKNSFPGGMQNG